MLGDCEHYASPYMRGVSQAMGLLGHPHAEVSIRLSAKDIAQRIGMWKPDVLWTHMLLWSPTGSPRVEELIQIVSAAAKAGARVIIHDGDAKPSTRYPHDLSAWCALALVNHEYDRSAWRVPVLRWPYFAATQKEIAKPVTSLRCGLFFAGTVGGGIYSARTALLDAIRSRGVDIRIPEPGKNTIDRTPEIASSSDAVLGFGRPSVPGWVDTRVFQYSGAGGILLHDDVQGYLEPWTHFVPYQSNSAESVSEAIARLSTLSDSGKMSIRQRAFAHVQAHHSSRARVRQVLAQLEMA